MDDTGALRQEIYLECKELGELCKRLDLRLATAESLTGGMIASSIIDIPGSSGYFDRGFVVYNNEAKHEVLGVTTFTLAQFTEVSGECVREMAAGALEHSHADIAVATSGLAGPSAGDSKQPVGTVWIAACRKGSNPSSKHFLFSGSRTEIRLKTCIEGLKAMRLLAEGEDPWKTDRL